MVSPDAVGELFASSSRVLTLRKLAEHAPQRVQARKTEAKIMEMMPPRVWLPSFAGVRDRHGR